MDERINIREATIKDLDELLKMEQELIKAEKPFDPTIRDFPVQYYDLEGMLTSEQFYVLVAETGGNIISSGYATARQARPYLDHVLYAYLGFMFTWPQYRGRGVNGRIISKLTRWAREKGFKEIRLSVYDENIPAIKAYEKVGFKKHLIEMRMRRED